METVSISESEWCVVRVPIELSELVADASCNSADWATAAIDWKPASGGIFAVKCSTEFQTMESLQAGSFLCTKVLLDCVCALVFVT